MWFEMVPMRNELLSLQGIEQAVEYKNSLALLQEFGVPPFLEKFDGINMVVALEFARM